MCAKRVVLAEYFTRAEAALLFIVREDFTEPYVLEINMPLDDLRRSVGMSYGMIERKLNWDELQRKFGPFIEPLLQWTDEGDIIWLVPYDALHYLPLHALKVGERYLIERNPICYTPSASIMKYCHKQRKGRRAKALVFGDSRNNLVHAREEALAVAELFETKPYLGSQATKALVKELLEKQGDQFDIIHLSCHGHFDATRALKSAIVLAPEQHNSRLEEGEDDNKWNLTAEEIFGLKMEVDLVTFSACETGINEYRPGDELIGLTRALIYAGTPSVVVSLWAVDDLSTGLFMQHFYQQLRKPGKDNSSSMMKVEALQAAQLYVMNLTARQVLDYCNRRLTQIDQHEDTERALSLLLGRVNAHIVAFDFMPAIDALQEIQKKRGTSANQSTEKLIAKAISRLPVLEHWSQKRLPVNYNAKPFEHPYYWAPFILVGDWK